MVNLRRQVHVHQDNVTSATSHKHAGRPVLATAQEMGGGARGSQRCAACDPSHVGPWTDRRRGRCSCWEAETRPAAAWAGQGHLMQPAMQPAEHQPHAAVLRRHSRKSQLVARIQPAHARHSLGRALWPHLRRAAGSTACRRLVAPSTTTAWLSWLWKPSQCCAQGRGHQSVRSQLPLNAPEWLRQQALP